MSFFRNFDVTSYRQEAAVYVERIASLLYLDEFDEALDVYDEFRAWSHKCWQQLPKRHPDYAAAGQAGCDAQNFIIDMVFFTFAHLEPVTEEAA